MEKSNESNMLENEYLELSNQLKEKFDENENIMNKLKKENETLKKDLISVYGYIRILDSFAENTMELDMEIKGLIEILRSYLSDNFEYYF